MRSAYGRDAAMRSCVRRSFDAATISIAFVTFCVLFTLAILVRISLPLAIALYRKNRDMFDFRPSPRLDRNPGRKSNMSLFFTQYVPVFLKASTIFLRSATFASLYSG